MNDLIEDVSKLTTIPSKTLNNLMDKFIYCIVDAVKENNLKGESITSLNVGFGILHIQCLEKQLKYKFTPSQKLSQSMSALINEGLNSLESVLETSLVNKLTDTYKDLI